MGIDWAYGGKKERGHTGKGISSERWTGVVVVVQFGNKKPHFYAQISTVCSLAKGPGA